MSVLIIIFAFSLSKSYFSAFFALSLALERALFLLKAKFCQLEDGVLGIKKRTMSSRQRANLYYLLLN